MQSSRLPYFFLPFRAEFAHQIHPARNSSTDPYISIVKDIIRNYNYTLRNGREAYPMVICKTGSGMQDLNEPSLLISADAFSGKQI